MYLFANIILKEIIVVHSLFHESKNGTQLQILDIKSHEISVHLPSGKLDFFFRKICSGRTFSLQHHQVLDNRNKTKLGVDPQPSNDQEVQFSML